MNFTFWIAAHKRKVCTNPVSKNCCSKWYHNLFHWYSKRFLAAYQLHVWTTKNTALLFQTDLLIDSISFWSIFIPMSINESPLCLPLTAYASAIHTTEWCVFFFHVFRWKKPHKSNRIMIKSYICKNVAVSFVDHFSIYHHKRMVCTASQC